MKSVSKRPVVNPVCDDDTIIIKRIKESENKRKSKPTARDIKEAQLYLRDFGLKKMTIPEFDTLAELLRWRLATALHSLND